MNVIILSNSLLPVFAEREELPTKEENNQFFVFEMKPFSGPIDARLDEKLKSRIGHYVRTELRRVFEGLDITKYRYSIPVPITLDEEKLFNSSVSLDEVWADKFMQELVTLYSDKPIWDLQVFVTAGFVPADRICKDLGFTIQRKNDIVRNLRERGYLSSDDVKRPKIGEVREYCYQMTEKLMDKIETDIGCVCFVRPKSALQSQKAA